MIEAPSPIGHSLAGFNCLANSPSLINGDLQGTRAGQIFLDV
jgi:hypothetical protein